jgi:gluconolactonase
VGPGRFAVAPVAVSMLAVSACGGANNPPLASRDHPKDSGAQVARHDAQVDAAVTSDASNPTMSPMGPTSDAAPIPDFSNVGPIVTVGDQFLFTEGPVWDPKKQLLYFSDINANTIYELALPDRIDVLLQPAGYPDGLALDPEGRLIVAGFVSRNVWRLDQASATDAATDGSARVPTITVIASTYQGRKLNSPDDLIARSDGVIYFTDSLFGINGTQGFPIVAPDLDYQGVFRVAIDGSLHLEDQTTSGPNGVAFSPDEKTLYVSYTSVGEIDSFAVADDGSLGDKKPFATGVVLADSMCVDSQGNVYVASSTGIVVFSPAGSLLATIPVGQIPTNPSFGGSDQKTLFVTARRSLIGTPRAGNSALLRIDNMPVPGLPGRP